MNESQLAYQKQKLDAGLCRRCGKNPRADVGDRRRREAERNLPTGRLSPYCLDCRGKASDRERERQRLARKAAQAGAPADVDVGAPGLDPDINLAMRRCADCREPLPAERYAADISFCFDCRPDCANPERKCPNPVPAAGAEYCTTCQPEMMMPEKTPLQQQIAAMSKGGRRQRERAAAAQRAGTKSVLDEAFAAAEAEFGPPRYARTIFQVPIPGEPPIPGIPVLTLAHVNALADKTLGRPQTPPDRKITLAELDRMAEKGQRLQTIPAEWVAETPDSYDPRAGLQYVRAPEGG